MIVDFQHHFTPRELIKEDPGDRLILHYDENGAPSYTVHSLLYDLDEHIRMMDLAGIDAAWLTSAAGMAADLEREIVAEQERAGIHDPSHFAYPTYAKAAMARRENLKRSIDELAAQLSGAKIALAESAEELKRVELLDQRDQSRDRAAEEGREQEQLGALAALRARGALA